ncbi:ATP-binding cassette domain-containing protein [Neobacillus drentensis]|uniref:ABC transporter ATP-binding protein/permease n=1 Tax=Neobacillus drentensis TaxID=220684 RepID=UPI001F3EA32D|nr:ABC transporter ATP-binding protein/permease [Neobacillus drentensis]ULT57459.1 ATP-binding cassette domain-containing protein [Neobacillus drentensis]
MLKLKLDNINKTYKSGEVVTALKGISIGFRENELVSILGPSGCGKTTLLNIIGGLDRYDSGDLIINGLSTKEFKNSDWDAYRNRSIGFVFQSYNLIGHQTVLQNVEIAMTLSGVSAPERKQRAKQALMDVGLADHLTKKPNQLSGGQMQRVAIARALVNDPDIILADEPTGALDSHTSVQVMDILKEVAKTRLVIMVTHNGELADQYSNRIIRLLDGEVQSDSNPVTEAETENAAAPAPKKQKFKKTSMSLVTATSLSFKNLLTKRGRTMITAFAGSIGIIGVALVLALSNGLSTYMRSMQADALSGYPITINTGEQTMDLTDRGPGRNNNAGSFSEYPKKNIMYSYDKEKNSKKHSNIITQDYLNYIGKLETKVPNTVNNISYTHGVTVNLLAKGQDTAVKFETKTVSAGRGMMGGNNSYWQELPASNHFILSLYDLIGEGSRMPAGKNEVVLVVDKYNRIDKGFFEKLGITDNAEDYKLTDFIGKSIVKVIPNNDYYTKKGDLFTSAAPADYEKLYDSSSGTKLTITGILRPKKDVTSSYLSPGIAYSPDLTANVVQDAQKSEIAAVQKASDKDVLLSTPFEDNTAKDQALLKLGADTTPTGINIYPKDYESKDKIKKYLDQYNHGKADKNQLIYSDLAETITSITGTLLNTVTYVLTGFAAISLLVSTIMIGIITYVSVIERTKEIGILRSVGARKKDVSRVFNAETLIIGFAAGILGVGISYLLTIPINSIIVKLAGISGIAKLNPLHAAVLVVGSMLLTLIAGFIPSRMAAKKDPVIALRSE